jgi:hypothetical protein
LAEESLGEYAEDNSGRTGPTLVQNFEELLRQAAAYSQYERFRSYVSRGEFKMPFSEIGETAGAVWQTLSNEGPVNFAKLMDEVNAPESLVFMAIGWLAREDKLAIEPAGGDYTVRLK